MNLRKRSLSKHARLALYIYYSGRCAICGSSLDHENFEADHIEPYSKNKITSPALMQATCRTCNRKKGDKSNG